MKMFLTSQFSKVGNDLQKYYTANGKKVAFITTAAEIYQEKDWMYEDKQKLVDLGFEVEEYDIRGKDEETLLNDLQTKDIIFVSGGNTFYLLQHIYKTGFDKVIKGLLSKGIFYIGSSAGSIIMCPSIEPVKTLDDPNEATELKTFVGLGLINFVLLPHYGKEKYEERYQKIIREYSPEYELKTLTDEQYVIVDGDSIKIV